MSRYWTRPTGDTVVRTARRLALAALVIPATGICAAQPVAARVTPPVREGLAAFRVHGPGGGGGQVIEGGRASGSQSRSGAGRFNQSLTGAVSPTFVMGQTQLPVTNTRSLDLQAAFCGSQPTTCAMGQNMPIRWKS